MFLSKFSYKIGRKGQLYFCKNNMSDVEMSTEEENHLEKPLINEEGNFKDGQIQVKLNESEDNKYELQRTIKELTSNLRKVKEDNEKMLKDQEELNTILLAKIHNDEKEKNKGSEHIMPKNTPYKRKGRKLEFFSHKAETSSEESVKHHSEKQQDSSESSDDNKNKNKYKLYE